MNGSERPRNSASCREAEFRAFYDENIVPLGRFAHSLERDYHEAEDIAAEAMLAMHEAWYVIPENKRRAYAFRVVRNLCASSARRRTRWSKWLAGQREQPDTKLDAVLDLAATREAITSLAPRRREMLRLAEAGLENHEIAEVLGIETRSVTQELSRARGTLRRQLGRRSATRQSTVDETVWEGGNRA